MAVWNGREHSEQVLEAAEHWKRQCFAGSGSVFTERSLWDEAKLFQLLETFRENPLLDRRSFIDKLEVQLEGSEVALQQLASEVLWLLLLFVSNAQMGPAAKRDRIERVWALSGEPFPDTRWMGDEHLSGVAKPGTAFMTKIPDEFEYSLSAISAFKRQVSGQQERLLAAPFDFAAWLDEQPGSDRRAFRHMLLYLLFPAEFERISSWRHKRQIRETFQDRLEPGELEPSDWSLSTTDRALRLIRARLEQEYGTSELDFYVSPLRELWLETGSDDEPGRMHCVRILTKERIASQNAI
jgi:5-methylcytosine-specific restriction enzyme B